MRSVARMKTHLTFAKTTISESYKEEGHGGIF